MLTMEIRCRFRATINKNMEGEVVTFSTWCGARDTQVCCLPLHFTFGDKYIGIINHFHFKRVFIHVPRKYISNEKDKGDNIIYYRRVA